MPSSQARSRLAVDEAGARALQLVRQSARTHDDDTLVTRPAFDRLAQHRAHFPSNAEESGSDTGSC